MERIIKFRCYQGYNSNRKGWKGLKRLKKMISWDELSSKWSLYDFTKALKHGNEDDRIIMQFTGLHDKNGKEIYEGDIIRCLPSKEFYREVVFHSGSYILINQSSDIQIPLGVVYTSHPESEVIGNIYESPELLKPTKEK